jgi:hypothetical protein
MLWRVQTPPPLPHAGGAGERSAPLPVVATEPRQNSALGERELATQARQQDVAGWIRGRVVDASTRAPIAGAVVRLVVSLALPLPPRVTTRTGDDGTFWLDGPARGDARLDVLAPGRNPRSLRVGGTTPRLDVGDVLLTDATVAGLRVTDERGDPVAGASVFWRTHPRAIVFGDASHELDGAPTFALDEPTATTDAEGQAAIPGATFGVHRLLVVHHGFRCYVREVVIRTDVARELEAVVLEAGAPVALTLLREDGGRVDDATVMQGLGSIATLVQKVAGSSVRVPSPPADVALKVTAFADTPDGSFAGTLDDPSSRSLVLAAKVPAAHARWVAAADDDDGSLAIWCFAVQRGSLWQQAAAVRPLAAGSWCCWPRRGPELRFVALSSSRGLGIATAAFSPRVGSRTPPPARAELQWRSLPHRVLRVVTANGEPAVDALVVGELELTDELAGSPVGGSQHPRAPFAETSGPDGIVDLGFVGGCRIEATVTMPGHAAMPVVLGPAAPEETRVELAAGGEVVVRVAAAPASYGSLRVGVRRPGRPARWFPVSGAEVRLADLERGNAEIVLEGAGEIATSLEPPVLDVRAGGWGGASLELDRAAVAIGPDPVWVDLAVDRGPVAELTVIAPRPLRVAVTSIGGRSLPRQRSFVAARTASTARVCGLFDGRWLVELLDENSRTVWWREVVVPAMPPTVHAALAAAGAAVDGGPPAAEGTVSALLEDGRTVPWLRAPLGIAGGFTTTAVPFGRYRAELRAADGPWLGSVTVDVARVTLRAAPR